jgi:hypothetical protein
MEKSDFADPFNAGQMVGMLVAFKFIESNPQAPQEAVDRIVDIAARNIEDYFDKPAEDIHLMINNLVKEL